MNCKHIQGTEYEGTTDTGKFTVVYIGILHSGRAIHMLLDVLADLPDVHCIIGGMGPPGYVDGIKTRCESLRNVSFLGKVPLEQVIAITKTADVVFLLIDPQDLNNAYGLANKQFEAMVCGRPIICAKGTYSGEVTEHEEVGLSIDYNREALKEAILRLKGDPDLRERLGRNALRAAMTKYNWQMQERTLLDTYNSLGRGPST